MQKMHFLDPFTYRIYFSTILHLIVCGVQLAFRAHTWIASLIAQLLFINWKKIGGLHNVFWTHLHINQCNFSFPSYLKVLRWFLSYRWQTLSYMFNQMGKLHGSYSYNWKWVLGSLTWFLWLDANNFTAFLLVCYQH